MYSSLSFTPHSTSWIPGAAFPAHLFAFLAINHFDQITTTSNNLEISKTENITVDAAATHAAEMLKQPSQFDSTSMLLLVRHDESGFGNRLSNSLLNTVDPAIHDNWSPWDCSISLGPHRLSGYSAINYPERVLLTSVTKSAMPEYPAAGDVIGDYTLQLGHHIDDDAELVLTDSSVSINFGGDGSPIGSPHYLVSSAHDPELQNLLQFLQQATGENWLCFLNIS